MKRAPARLLESANLSPIERRVLEAGRAVRVDFDVGAGAKRLRHAIQAGESALASTAAHSSIAAGSVKLACVLASVAGLGGAAYYALSERTAAPRPAESRVVSPQASDGEFPGAASEVEREPAAALENLPHALGSSSERASTSEGHRSHAARKRRASVSRVAGPKVIEPQPPVEPRREAAEASVPPPVLDSVQPTVGDSKPPLLMAELRDVARARALLERDPNQALLLLERLRSTHPHGFVLEERAALSVLALAAAGQRDLAERRAAEFLRRSPESPFADRVRRAVKR